MLFSKQIDPTQEGLKRTAEVSRLSLVTIEKDGVQRELVQVVYDIDALTDADVKIPQTNQKDFRTYDMDPENAVDAEFMLAYRKFINAKGADYSFVDPNKLPQEVTDEN